MYRHNDKLTEIAENLKDARRHDAAGDAELLLQSLQDLEFNLDELLQDLIIESEQEEPCSV